MSGRLVFVRSEWFACITIDGILKPRFLFELGSESRRIEL